jgi:ABC-type enterobactin transport system permease subunit
VSEEPREIEVVDVGRGPTRPSRPPRDRTGVLLTLVVVGVFLGAACSAFTAWTVHQQAQDTRELNCAFLLAGDQDATREYKDLAPYEKKVVDALDCDIKGR